MFVICKSIDENILLGKDISMKVMAIKGKNVLFGFTIPKNLLYDLVKPHLTKMPCNDKKINMV